MKLLTRQTPAAIDPVQGRFGRARLRLGRRGSVLIIVIGLLVLMAIIGTAYVSTARTDRVAAATNSQNTEAQLQLQGLEDIVTAQIVNDINPYVTQQTVNGANYTINAARFRPGWTAATPPFANYNSPLNDQWLSSRVPVGLDPTTAVVTTDQTTNPAVWRFLSFPTNTSFSDPTVVGGTTYGGASNSAGGGVYLPVSTTWNGVVYPALQYLTTPSSKTWSGTYLAADTDGDGMADAGLFRMPGGEIDGITYYGAYRVVDNSAAINAAVAWTQQEITPKAPTIVTSANESSQQPLPGNFWPTNIDLANLVPDSLDNLNKWRFGAASPNTTPTEGAYAFGYQAGYSADYPSGVGYNCYDAAWHELGRRLQNPATGYQAMTLADSAAMAHRFVIRDPNASYSNFENYLPQATLNNAPTSSYLPYDWVDWYNQNFNYTIGQQASTANLRSLVTAYNPVSCFTPCKYGPTGGTPGATWNASTNYTFGDWVTYNNHAYVCIQPNTGQTPSTTLTTAGQGIPNYYTDTQFWCYEPWANAPVKTNVNTGSFAQLWLAYWNVMCDAQNQAPNQPTSETAVSTGGAMFRSSIRASTGTPGSALGSALSATQELQLRAALAAINTIDLRTTGNTYSQLSVQTGLAIDDYSTPSPKSVYYATVAGNKPQPYITEVYADDDPTVGDGSTGYIAVEVYNPYPYPIQLLNWAFATVDRKGGAGVPLTITPVASTTTGASNWSSATATTTPVIPANGYAVFSNTGNAVPTDYTTGPTATTANAIANPTAANPPLYVLPDLTQAFDNDLILMRPPPSAGASASGINTWIPTDSYDFTGLKKWTSFTMNATFEWHYARPQAMPWTFVYPGPYNSAYGVAPQYNPRFTATQTWPVGTAGAISFGNLASLGKADSMPTSGNGSFPATPITIQLNNVDFGGPVKLSSGSTNYFPFGQFPRNGDILQVPFIGSYCLWDGPDPTTAHLIEINPITLDSAYAAAYTTDGSAATAITNAAQNIGRFAPYWSVDYSQTNPIGTTPVTTYGWATRLFDYLTVQAPGDDYLPNTDPVQYQLVTGKQPLAIANAKSSVINALATQSVTEDTVPLHGLININTAPWRVLAALPFSDDPNTNAALAQAIVNYRDGYWNSAKSQYYQGFGPFESIFDLNNVIREFNNTQTGLSTSAVPNISFISTLGSYNNAGIYADAYAWNNLTRIPSNNDGLLTPLYSTFNTAYPSANPPYPGYVPTDDFQEYNLALNRVSNLITTRSDCYTVYVTVQGWAYAGTSNARMVVQRRAAFIVDRSQTTPSNPSVKITSVSTN